MADIKDKNEQTDFSVCSFFVSMPSFPFLEEWPAAYSVLSIRKRGGSSPEAARLLLCSSILRGRMPLLILDHFRVEHSRTLRLLYIDQNPFHPCGHRNRAEISGLVRAAETENRTADGCGPLFLARWEKGHGISQDGPEYDNHKGDIE